MLLRTEETARRAADGSLTGMNVVIYQRNGRSLGTLKTGRAGAARRMVAPRHGAWSTLCENANVRNDRLPLNFSPGRASLRGDLRLRGSALVAAVEYRLEPRFAAVGGIALPATEKPVARV